MPRRKCCVPSCNSSLIEGAILHAFPNPSELEKFQAWVTNAGVLGEDEDYVFRNMRICRLHFETIYLYPKNRLSRLAIPASSSLTGLHLYARESATFCRFKYARAFYFNRSTG